MFLDFSRIWGSTFVESCAKCLSKEQPAEAADPETEGTEGGKKEKPKKGKGSASTVSCLRHAYLGVSRPILITVTQEPNKSTLFPS